MAMATLISAPTPARSSFSTCARARLLLLPHHQRLTCPPSIPHLGSSTSPQWSGSKQQLGLALNPKSLRKGRKKRSKGKVVGVRASLFGVGAPEALVIGVVALLVFGPKGLAEVARNLGKTLRAFQPTIRELQEVSREFKSTLEKEIGLDDITNATSQTTNISNRTPTAPAPPPPPPVSSPADSPAEAELNGVPTADNAYTSEEYLKVTEDQLKKVSASQLQAETPAVIESPPEAKVTEEQPKASGEQQQEQPPPPAYSQTTAAVEEAATTTPGSVKPESET